MRKKYAASAAQAELEEKMEEEKVKEWKRKYHESRMTTKKGNREVKWCHPQMRMKIWTWIFSIP
jgi:hypothetical protein